MPCANRVSIALDISTPLMHVRASLFIIFVTERRKAELRRKLEAVPCDAIGALTKPIGNIELEPIKKCARRALRTALIREMWCLARRAWPARETLTCALSLHRKLGSADTGRKLQQAQPRAGDGHCLCHFLARSRVENCHGQ